MAILSWTTPARARIMRKLWSNHKPHHSVNFREQIADMRERQQLAAHSSHWCALAVSFIFPRRMLCSESESTSLRRPLGTHLHWETWWSRHSTSLVAARSRQCVYPCETSTCRSVSTFRRSWVSSIISCCTASCAALTSDMRWPVSATCFRRGDVSRHGCQVVCCAGKLRFRFKSSSSSFWHCSRWTVRDSTLCRHARSRIIQRVSRAVHVATRTFWRITGTRSLRTELLCSFYHCLKSVITRPSLLLMDLQIAQYQYWKFRPILNRIPEYHHFDEQL